MRGFIRRLIQRSWRLNGARNLALRYDVSLKGLAEQGDARNKDLAVVIHLYYTDNWSYFLQKLEMLSVSPFDLYITLPQENVGFMDTIRQEYPDARYLVSPNQGRDVLPFVIMAQHLSKLGYKSLLKFHSKKSLHWGGGDDWLHEALDSLLPSKRGVANILTTLKAPKTGIIGPRAFYYPLSINFPANGSHMTRLMTKLYNSSTAHEILQNQRKNFGFFGGTMFWCRTDAITRVLEAVDIAEFELEAGQIDGTYAHALERIFCIAPEVDGRMMYQVDKNGLTERPYVSDNIPEWSTDHDK